MNMSQHCPNEIGCPMIPNQYRATSAIQRKARVWASLLIGSAMAASANTLVTFQVDMSTAAFAPASQTVEVRGNFNNWGMPPFALTNNPSGLNTNLWSGTANLPLNGSVIAFRYVIQPGGQYEYSHNRLALLPSASGSNLIIPRTYYNDAPPAPLACSVTFQVDLAQQISIGAFIPDSSTCEVRGAFNGWGDTVLAHDPTIVTTNVFGLVTSNVYVCSYQITGSPGQTIDYKYYIDTGHNWESPAPGTGDPNDNNNRFFNLAEGATQALPIVYFSDIPYAPEATNDVTFQVDMSSQILLGNFDPSSGSVAVWGDFNGWGSPPLECTNSPAHTNVYTAVARVAAGAGTSCHYRFWATVPANFGLERLASDRTFQIVIGPAQVLPPVYFEDLYIDPADVLPEGTIVTLSVNMTNAVGTDTHAFNPNTDAVAINGLPPFGFTPWTTDLPTLTNNPVGSGIYTLEYTIPKGSPVQLTYRYGINFADDEAALGTNHVRLIRQGSAYTLPTDRFGTMYAEPSFGQLTIGPASGGHVPVAWLGRVGAHLQSREDLSSGAWQDHFETDGSTWRSGYFAADGFVSTTNIAVGVSKTFLRIVKP
jgi:hypothetical protein